MRVKFPAGQQQAFLENIQRLTGAKVTHLANRLGVCARTVRDWRREKWQMDDESLHRLCRIAKVPRPTSVTLLPEHWSVPKAGRIGGLRHFELYGSPGTPESRSRGGQRAQKLFRSHPAYFRSLGVAVRKSVKKPPRSADLAEFVGIVLGDGGITNRQVTISFNTLDLRHAEYVKQLIIALFGIHPGSHLDPADHTFTLIASGVELVEILEALGLKKGNKVKQQVDVPSWIWRARRFQVACLRGLMDTDGCVFRHRYRVNGKMYGYTKLCFTSYSRPLLDSAKKLFESLSLFPTIHQYDGHRLYLHDTAAVRRYFKLVGTSNPRYQSRFDEYNSLTP